MSDEGLLVPSLEKGIFSSFRQSFTTFRQGQIGSHLIDFKDLQLPTNSVLHIANNYLEYPVTSILPNLDDPFIKNEQYHLFVDFVLTIPAKTDPLFPVTDSYRFRPYSYNSDIRKFYTEHKNIKKFTSRKATLSQSSALPILNYDVISTALVTGTFIYYRRFDILLRTILSNVVSIEGKHQYLQMELSRTLYRKVQFQQTFDKISYQTIRIKNDPSFYFLIHLVNFLSKTATTSLFSKLTQVQLDQLNIILTAGDKAIIYNLGDLKAMLDARKDDNLYQMVIRHISALKLAGYADMDITDLDDTQYEKLVDDVAPPETEHPDEPTIHPELISNVTHNITSSSGDVTKNSSNGTDNKQTDTTPTVVPEPTKVEDATVKTTGGADKKPVQIPTIIKVEPPATSKLKPYDTNKPTSVIDHAAQTLIVNNPNLTDEQKTRALQVAQTYKTLEIDGHPIEELLDQTAEPDITQSHLDFLKDKLPDQSMLNSTAIDLDRHYVQQMMAKDIAAVAANMATNGMFLVEVTQKDEVTELDRIRNYKFTYEDVNGRKHRVVFKLPIVSPDGTILINGIESRMIKQQINLPICKIDNWRVSLSSNYNKTLVERIATKAHNYCAYITKYIAAVYKAKVGLEIGYGNLTTDKKLPYDYTSIAGRYSRLAFDNYKFTFDYENRLNALSYTEFNSTFTDDGIEYSVTNLLKETENIPIQEFKVDDLKWLIKFNKDYDESDKVRVKNANLEAPILVFRDKKGRLNIVDGMHRLQKAVSSGVKTLPGKLVPPDMLERNRISKPATESLGSDVWLGLEKKYGVYCGTGSIGSKGGVNYLFFGYDNFIRGIDSSTGKIIWKKTFTDLFFSEFENHVPVPKPLSEWTELKIQDKNFPIVFILGFEFGLKKVLDHIKLDYKFYPIDTKFDKDFSTIVVPFSDGNLVFDRYPLDKSFVASGFLKFNTKPYPFSKFDTPDGYYTLLQDSGFSMNYLKGITDFFKLFIDPITRDVLLKMHEPTDVAGLLLRATQMLTTDDAIPSASMKNHRLRGYERFPSILYNEMARSYATYANQRGNRKVFSINPEAVFLRIIQDQSLHIVDEINPMENIKDKHAITYAGTGGRTAQSFVIEDRQYPKDGVGILSECTPDSGKVALNAYITANPVIQNIRGMFDTDNIDQSKLEPSQILSATSLLMPCSTNDDARRSNYLSIQLKHHVPSQFSETNRIRTGYELVVAHRTGETFACIAQRDGIVEEVNSDLGLIKIKYESVKHKPLDLNLVSNSNTIRTKFNELALSELLHLKPIYIIQEDSTTTKFKQGDMYSLGNYVLKVTDISPLDLNNIPMDYLTDTLKSTYKKLKSPVVVKLVPIETDATQDTDIFKFGVKFSSVSGSFLKQNIVANVKAGDKVSRGDVIAYNTGFFELDQFDPKQVTWKHGVMARVALMECNDTIEDSNAITEEFSHRLQMEPAHVRTIELTKNTILSNLLPLGTEVQTTDLLCTLEDADIGLLTESDDSQVLDLLNELNRKAPRARYHGIISEIDVLYACPIEDMHPSVAALVKAINAKKSKIAKAARDTFKSTNYADPNQVTVGTKFKGIEFFADTIVILIYISEHLDQGPGDKLVLANQAKSVSATVIEQPISTESGYPIDMLFSARGVSNRILLSPTITGFGNRILQELENQVIQKYFSE